jgi:TetR/AcrR family transcriptional regulator, fatty acid metabolism regulator protein
MRDIRGKPKGNVMTSEAHPLPLKKRQRTEVQQALKQVTDKAELHPTYSRLRERQRIEREQLILQAADELLIEKGYHDTSIEDIAARVGISKGTVYLHFASKEDLVFALLERGVRQLQATLDDLLSSPGTPREKLHAVMRQLCAGMMSRQRLQLVEALFHDPELRGRLMEGRESFGKLWDVPRERISALLDEGKALGEFDAETPTSIMLSYFWGALSPHHFRTLIVEKHMQSELVVAHLSRCFFKGIAPGGECPAIPAESVQEGGTPA